MLLQTNVERGDDGGPSHQLDRQAGTRPHALETGSVVAARLAPHKKIRFVEFIQQIPRSASGKILRRVLVEKERSRCAPVKV